MLCDVPCSRAASMQTVYAPGGSGFPWSSLPSQTAEYLPGGRVGRDIVSTSSRLSAVFFRNWSAAYQRVMLWIHWKGPEPPWETQRIRLRTGNPALSSTQTATYGRR